MTSKFKKNVVSLANILIENDYFGSQEMYDISEECRDLDDIEYKQLTLLLLRYLFKTNKPLNRSSGICNQFYACNIDLMRIINLEDWPHYSGYSAYPIETTLSFDDPCEQYHNTGDKWQCGEYSALRWELIQYIINKLEEELNE